MNDKIFKFPSPSRGSYFSIITGEAYVLPQTFVFPSPSRGSYFSIYMGKKLEQIIHLVSVPFPGILFLNTRGVSTGTATSTSFRPLPGDLISQYNVDNAMRELWKQVSVPFPGILFLNASDCGTVYEM